MLAGQALGALLGTWGAQAGAGLGAGSTGARGNSSRGARGRGAARARRARGMGAGRATGRAVGPTSCALGLFSTRFDSELFLSQIFWTLLVNPVHEHCSSQIVLKKNIFFLLN